MDSRKTLLVWRTQMSDHLPLFSIDGRYIRVDYYEEVKAERDRLAAQVAELVALVRIGFLVTLDGERATPDLVRNPGLRGLLFTILQAEDTDAARAALTEPAQTIKGTLTVDAEGNVLDSQVEDK
jgi:hypothetical protein